MKMMAPVWVRRASVDCSTASGHSGTDQAGGVPMTKSAHVPHRSPYS